MFTSTLSVVILAALVLAPLTHAQDLSGYRQFRLGSDLEFIANQTGMATSDARTIHLRPALIQELEWHPGRQLGQRSKEPDSVSEIRFSFYNGDLFQILVRYDRDKTEGLTDADLIGAISGQYGLATRPMRKNITFSSSSVYNDKERIIACWEDAQYSFNLYRSSFQPTFGMIVFAKKLDVLARAAIASAIRLDAQEAPQREIDRKTVEDRESRVSLEKARLLNKSAFRP
jgi:hypothetical protein